MPSKGIRKITKEIRKEKLKELQDDLQQRAQALADQGAFLEEGKMVRVKLTVVSAR